MSILKDAQLREALDKSPSGVRVTQHMIDQRIKDVQFTVLDGTTVTICNITLDNGFSVRGESACVDPANFNKDVGETYAYQKAHDRLWELFGFLVAEMRFAAGVQEAEYAELLSTGESDGD